MRLRALVAAPFVGVIAYTAVPALPDDAALTVYNVTAAATAVIAWIVLLVKRPKPALPWFLITGALSFWVAGDLTYTALGGDPIVSVADVLYFTAYSGLGLAATQLLRRRTRERDLDAVLDATLIGIASFLFLWILVIGPDWNEAGVSTTGRLMAACYPLLDVVLLFFLVRLLFAFPRPPASMLVFVGAIGAVLVADIAYAGLVQTDAYHDNLQRTLDGLWLVGYALVPVAMLVDRGQMTARPDRAAVRRPSRLIGLLAAGIALVALPAADVAARTAGQPITAAVLAIAGGAIVLLVFARIIRLHGSLGHAFAEVDRQQRYYRAVADNSSDSFVVLSPAGVVLDASGTLEGILGYGRETAVGSDALTVVHPEDRLLAEALLADSLASPGRMVSSEMRVTAADSSYVWMELCCTNLCADPAVGGIVVNAHDMSARKEFEAELERRALHDGLTGLANRVLLRDRIEHALARRSRDDNDVAVLFCDLDGFKLVNDTIGHDAGDELLCVTAARFLDVVRPSDTVARIGGDEFAALIEGSGDLVTEALGVADRLLEAISQPVEIRGNPMIVTASIGIAAASQCGQTLPDDLLRDADTAMYSAKATGRNRAVLYDPSMGRALMTRAQLGADLHHAVERGELGLRYQPIVDLRTRGIVAFEALLRWSHPTRGSLGPDRFITIAEDNGTIVEIGSWALNAACRDATTWTPCSTGEAPTVSVNVSARQLVQADFVDRVTDALRTSGLPADRLVVELTESALVDHTDDAAARLHALELLGVRVAIDDFGVGQSSLSYLRQFPVDILKLDRSFTEMITSDDGVPALIGGLLELARTLNLRTLAEGVETHAQRRALVKEGCEFGQGYLFSRPVDPGAVAQLLWSDLLPADPETVGPAS